MTKQHLPAGTNLDPLKIVQKQEKFIYVKHKKYTWHPTATK